MYQLLTSLGHQRPRLFLAHAVLAGSWTLLCFLAGCGSPDGELLGGCATSALLLKAQAVFADVSGGFPPSFMAPHHLLDSLELCRLDAFEALLELQQAPVDGLRFHVSDNFLPFLVYYYDSLDVRSVYIVIVAHDVLILNAILARSGMRCWIDGSWRGQLVKVDGIVLSEQRINVIHRSQRCISMQQLSRWSGVVVGRVHQPHRWIHLMPSWSNLRTLRHVEKLLARIATPGLPFRFASLLAL